MQSVKNERNRILVLLVFVALVAAYAINIAGPSHPRKIIVEGDGCGHYDYLPALLIEHTVDFNRVFQVEKMRHSSSYMGHYFHRINGVVVNKYTSGTSWMISPFFLLAYLLSLIFGRPTDGFGLFFQYSVVVAGAFWLIVGLYSFIKLLKLYKINTTQATLFALLLLFGTNLFFYAFVAPAFSHVYSFALLSVLLLTVKKFFLLPRNRLLYLAAFLYGLLVLIRPVNGIVFFVLPALAGTKEHFLNRFRFAFRPSKIATVVFLVLLAISPQIIINWMQSGRLFIDGYADEGFYFLHPQIINFLFSYRKGWFVYTPIMFLLIPAMVFWYKKNRFGFWIGTLFFIFQVYLFSAWWNWFYGDSFGMRPMVDYYALYFLLISLYLHRIEKKSLRITLIACLSFFLFLNLFQTYQYAEGILHPDSMNKKAYWYLFLKSGTQYKHAVGDCDESFYGKLSKKPFLITKDTYDGTAKGWSNARIRVSDPAGSGETVSVVNQRYLYSSTYIQHLPATFIGQSNLYVLFKADYFETMPNEALKAFFVVDILDKTGKKSMFYKAFRIKRLPDKEIKQWRASHIGFKLPTITKEDKIVKYYVWYQGKHLLYLHHLSLDFYTWQ